MLIGVVGLNGAGKDTFADYLAKNYSFAHKDLGQEIRDELKRLGKNPLDRNEMVLLGNARRKEFGFNYWAKQAIETASSPNLVITSVRNPSEIDEIVSNKGVVIEVFADISARYKRTVERVKNNPSAHGDAGSFAEFKAKEDRELSSSDPSKQQLLKCISLASHKVDNNGSVSDFEKKIESLLKNLENEHNSCSFR